jgi:hypothetical protein
LSKIEKPFTEISCKMASLWPRTTDDGLMAPMVNSASGFRITRYYQKTFLFSILIGFIASYPNREVINEIQGERWLCSEEEAIAAGWRKALNCP